jgi:hypothetical protein
MDEIIRVEISANNSIRITKIAPHIRNTFSRDHKLIQLFLPGRDPEMVITPCVNTTWHTNSHSFAIEWQRALIAAALHYHRKEEERG